MKRIYILCLLALFLVPGLAQTATRIVFPPDQIRTMESGKVAEGQMQVFVLPGHAQQPTSLYLMSAESNGNFEMMDPDGNLVASGKADKFGARKWKGLLPKTGEYSIVVYSERGLADFQLTIEMP
jgi:hypothetical protein